MVSQGIDAERHPVEFSCWLPGGSLAGFFGCREIALELVCGADFSCKLMCGAGPGDLGGSGGRFRPEIQAKPGRRSPARLPSGTQAEKLPKRNPPREDVLGCAGNRTANPPGETADIASVRRGTPDRPRGGGRLQNSATCKLLEPHFSPQSLAGISGFWVHSGLASVVLGWSRLPRGGRDRYSNRLDRNST